MKGQADIEKYGKWTYNGAMGDEAISISAVILAGGKSTRMHGDKALLPVGGEPLVGRIIRQLQPLFNRIAICAADAAPFQSFGVPVIADERPGAGPLAAIASALRAINDEAAFILACDIPDIDPATISGMRAALQQADVVVPQHANGTIEPLFALYRRHALPLIDGLLKAENYQVFAFYPQCRTVYFPLGQQTWLKNLNTYADYLRYLHEVEKT